MALNLSLRWTVGILFCGSLGIVAACGGSGSSAVDPKLTYSGVYVGSYTRADGQVMVSVANKQAEVAVFDSDAGAYLGSANISSNGHFGGTASDPNDFNVPPVTITFDANATDAGNRFQYNVAVTGGPFTVPPTPAVYVGPSVSQVFVGTYDGTYTGTKSGNVRFLVTSDEKIKTYPTVDGTALESAFTDLQGLHNQVPFTANGTAGTFTGYFRYTSATVKTFTGTWTLGTDSGTFTTTIVN